MTRQSLQPQGDDGNCEEGEFSSSWLNTLPLWGSGCSKHHLGFCGSVSTTGCAPCQTWSSCHSLQNTPLWGTSHDCHVHMYLSTVRHGAFFLLLPADFLCCSNLLQKVKDILSSIEKLEANKKTISWFWNPPVALYKKNPARQEALAVLCRQARTQTRHSCGCLRKVEPPAVKII